MPSRFHKDFVPELDGLRAFAVFTVLWAHLPVGALGMRSTELQDLTNIGNAGVDLFFVLSGFLITRILLVDRDGGVPLRWFLVRRFLRIFPIYYITILALLPRLSSFETWATATYTANFAFIWMEKHGALDHTWSLAIEEHFYLIWPPIVAFLTPLRSRLVLLLGFVPLALLTGLGALFLGNWAEYSEQLWEFELRSSTVRFFSLALGALLAYHEPAIRTSRRFAKRVFFGAVALCFLLSEPGLRLVGILGLLENYFADKGGWDRQEVAVQVFSLPFGSVAAVVLCVVWTGSWSPYHWILRTRLMRGLGRVSYATYLFHLPLFFMSGVWEMRANEPQPLRVATVILLCYVVSTASYFMVERPLLGFAKRFRAAVPGRTTASRKVSPWALLSMVLFGFGLHWLLNTGAPRIVAEVVEVATPDPAGAGAAERRARSERPDLTAELEARAAEIHDLWRQEFRERFDRSYPRPPFVVFLGPETVAGALRTGHFVDVGRAATGIDVAFVADALERAGDLGPLARDYALAHLSARSAQVMAGVADVVRKGHAADPAAGRTKLAAHAEALAGAILARAEPASAGGLAWDRERAARVLAALRGAEADLALRGGDGALHPTEFSVLSLEDRVTWFLFGLESGDITQAGKALSGG